MSRLLCHKNPKYVKPTFAGRRIATLTAEQFDDWMADLAADEIPARTINLARQSINTPLNNLVLLRRLPWNPLSAVKPYHKNPAKRGTLTAEEYRKLLALDGLDPRVRLANALGGLCGGSVRSADCGERTWIRPLAFYASIPATLKWTGSAIRRSTKATATCRCPLPRKMLWRIGRASHRQQRRMTL